MEKDVMIVIRGTSEAGKEKDRTELIVPGQYFWRNEHHFLLFEEQQEGLDRPIATMIRFTPAELRLKKRGPVETEMSFRSGEETNAVYQTPYGAMDMEIRSGRIRIRESEKMITAAVDYTLSTEGKLLSKNEIRIRVTPRKDGIRLSQSEEEN